MERLRVEGAPSVDELAAYVRELDRRVSALESRQGPSPCPEFRQVAAVNADQNTASATLAPVSASVVPVLGKALLGAAGGYLLRAFAESGTAPQVIAVIAGLVYAAFWLISASRAHPGDSFTATAYSLTAAVVLFPMLWETTLRFGMLPPAATAAILVLFVSGGAALSWVRGVPVITWITTLAGLGTSLALLIATHALAPFTAAILVMAAVIEYAACRDHFLGERWIAAFAANLAVLILTLVVGRRQGLPEGYVPVGHFTALALQMALGCIYLGSTVYRTLVHHLPMTVFEVGQAVLACIIALAGALSVVGGSTAGAAGVAGVCLAAGAGCYFVAFALAAHETRHRNFHAYASFGILLLFAGIWILFAENATYATLVCALLAISAAAAARRMDSATMETHSAVYLAIAAVVSGLLPYAASGMLGQAAVPFPPPLEPVVAGLTAVLCFAALGGAWTGAARLPGSVVAVVLCSALLAFAAAGVKAALPGEVRLHAAVMPAVRTALLCAMALGLVAAATRLRRRELLWLLYPLTGFAIVRVLTEDLPGARPASLAISLLLYGGTLIVLPGRVRAALAARSPDDPSRLARVAKQG